MPTIIGTIKRLLPQGSRGTRTAPSDWNKCPAWPPDAFAVAATLIELSACYAHIRVGADDPDGYLRRIRACGEAWRDSWDAFGKGGGEQEQPEVPSFVQEQWAGLLSHGEDTVSAPASPGDEPKWWEPAMNLLAAADEASVGVGFHLRSDPPSSFIAKAVFVARSHRLSDTALRGELLPQQTLCRAVPEEEACVQPKSRTAQVGCTLRSLSHHLALLPPSGEARSEWWISPVAQSNTILNLLLVPLPYRLPSRAFQPVAEAGTGNYYTVDPNTWLPSTTRVAEVTRYLADLVKAAQAQGGTVHGIVLPELALDADTAKRVARRLHDDLPGALELFVTGFADPVAKANTSYVAVFDRDDSHSLWDYEQRKHHRWRLEGGQIGNYGLAHVLDSSRIWWEHTALGAREIKSLVFRDGASLNVLVCEDLARLDPAQVYLRAMGPSLVIALLMDGPQVSYRWPGQCGTVLAEDPGSSVLTLTSLGMVRRHRRSMVERDSKTEQPPEWNVALWKESGQRPTQLTLKDGSHAIMVSLCFRDEEELTLDRRSDGCTSVRVSLAQSRQVRHPKPPEWVCWP